MAKEYTAIQINSTTQVPEDITFTDGQKSNMPFPVTIPEVADVTAVTGLDSGSCQLVFDVATSALAVSPTGQTTYTQTYAADV